MIAINSCIPKVSVLMACFNASRWLHESISSVLDQTYKDFELILVDDGSTDDTASIIQEYKKRDGRIIAIRKTNTGLADSLNVGIKHAKGQWIARLDADDLSEPTRLQKQIAFVTQHPETVLLGSGSLEIDENGRILRRYSYPTSHAQLVRRLERLKGFFSHSSAFYRVEAVRQVGGYNPRITRAEDRRLWLDIVSRGNLASLSMPLVRVRKHSNQISNIEGGERQYIDATAATICHFLAEMRQSDPSKFKDESRWREFSLWVETRVREFGKLEQQKAWSEARYQYVSSGNLFIGLLRFCKQIISSGHASGLLRTRIVGEFLPKRLAREWVNGRRI